MRENAKQSSTSALGPQEREGEAERRIISCASLRENPYSQMQKAQWNPSWRSIKITPPRQIGKLLKTSDKEKALQVGRGKRTDFKFTFKGASWRVTANWTSGTMQVRAQWNVSEALKEEIVNLEFYEQQCLSSMQWNKDLFINKDKSKTIHTPTDTNRLKKFLVQVQVSKQWYSIEIRIYKEK